MEVVVSRGSTRFRVTSVYLPPNAQAAAWDSIRAALAPPDDIPHYLAGDFNIQLVSPREGEAETAQRIREDIARCGCAFMPQSGATRWGYTGPSQIDHIAVPLDDVVHSQVRHVWQRGQSDHAQLQLVPAPVSASRSIPTLTPHIFNSFHHRR